MIMLAYFCMASIYFLVFAIAGKIWLKKRKNKRASTPSVNQNTFTLFVAAYKNDIILETAKNLLKLDYPKELFEIHILGDHLSESCIALLKELPIHLHVFNLKESTKAKSLQLGIQKANRLNDYIVILDIDNHVSSSFLREMNQWIVKGSSIYQSIRSPFPQKGEVALLDSVSDSIDHTIFRAGQNALHLSSTLAGSGIVFSKDVYLDYIPQLKAIGGFDKELELMLSKNHLFVHYVPEAKIYDEKVSQHNNFYSQRRRWLSAQLYYAKKGVSDGLKSILSFNINYINKVFHLFILPRLLHVFFILALSVLYLLLKNSTLSIIYLALAAISVLGLVIAIPRAYLSLKLFYSLTTLPLFILNYLKVITRLKGANSHFIHTKHFKQKKKQEL